MSEILDQPWAIYADDSCSYRGELAAPEIQENTQDDNLALSEGTLSHAGSREIAEELPDYHRAFAEHVAAVRDNGDILEPTRRFYDLKSTTGRNAVRGSVLGTIGFHIPDVALGASVAAGAAAGAMWYLDYRARKKIEPALDDFESADASEDIGERYELYRVKDKTTGENEIVMRWFGTLDSIAKDADGNWGSSAKKADESMKLISELAEAEGIKAVLVGDALIENTHFKPEQYASEKISVPKWFDKHKDIKTEFMNSDQEVKPYVYAFTPAKLLEMAAEPHQQMEQVESLETIINVLRGHDPQHRIIRAYQETKGDSYEVMKAVADAARRSLEPKLQDIGSKFSRNSDGAPIRDRVLLQGRISGDIASMQGTGKYNGQELDRTSLLRAFHMSEDQVTEILQNHDEYADRKVVLAAECAAYLQAQRPPLPTETEVDSPFLVSWEQNTGEAINASLLVKGEAVNRLRSDYVSDRTVSTKETYTFRRKLGAGAMAAGVIVATAISMNADSFDARPISDGVELVGNGLGAFDDGLHDIGHRIGNLWSDAPAGFGTSDGRAASSTNSAKIGNVEESERDRAKVDWKIHPHGGMSADGYWADNTAEYFDIESFDWLKQFETTSDIAGSAPNIPSDITEALHKNGDDAPYLSVQRTINGEEGGTLQEFDGTSTTFLQIPVLEGTKPVAANLNGEAISLQESQNGTYALAYMTYSGQKNLTYWLVRDEQAHVATNTNLEQNEQLATTKTNPNFLEAQYTLPEQDQVRQSWEKALGREYTNDHERFVNEVAYVRSNYDYSRTPLDQDLQGRMDEGKVRIPEFVDAVLDDTDVVCNTAAMVVAADNPEVVPVTGYLNSKETNLTVGESHMWLTDRQGNYYDPTPGGSDTIKEEPKSFTNPGTLAVAGMALAGMAFGAARNRRRIAGKLDAVQTERAAQKASAESATFTTEDLYFAKQVTDRSDYASSLSLDTMGKLPEDKTREQVMEMVTAPHLHDENLVASLTAAIARASNPVEKLALQRADHVLTTIRKAGLARGYAAPETERSTDLSGVL